MGKHNECIQNSWVSFCCLVFLLPNRRINFPEFKSTLDKQTKIVIACPMVVMLVRVQYTTPGSILMVLEVGSTETLFHLPTLLGSDVKPLYFGVERITTKDMTLSSSVKHSESMKYVRKSADNEPYQHFKFPNLHLRLFRSAWYWKGSSDS